MKGDLQPRQVVPISFWRSSAWPLVMHPVSQPYEDLPQSSSTARALDSQYHQTHGPAARPPDLPRPMAAPAADETRMASGRAGLGADPRSRSVLSARPACRGSWNVAVFCPGPPAGEHARRRLEQTLATLNLRVQCHFRQWLFSELDGLSEFEAAVDHALEADLVIVSLRGHEPLPDGLHATLAEWLIRSGLDSSPLAITFDDCIVADETCEGLLATLRRLTDRAHLPLRTDFRDAVWAAWDLWQWWHFPWAAAEASLARRRTHSLTGPRGVVERCRRVSPSRARAGTGGTRQHPFTVSHHEPSLGRCQS